MKISDPRWRINNLYKIVNKEGRLVTFKENEHQAKVNSDPALEKMILKSRQIGFSTGCLIKLLDTTIFNKHQTSVILAHETDSIKKLFRIIYRAIKFMHPALQPVIDRGGGSKYEYFFPEVNSRIYCDLESRSDTIQNLHVSEIGLMKNDDRVRATVDAVPIGGSITYESTAKGLNHFHEMWNNPNSSIKKFFFPWYVVKEYQLPTKPITDITDDEKELIFKAQKHYNVSITHEQIAFRRWKISQKGGGIRGYRAFQEEFPEDDQSCFLSSGDSVFDLLELTKARDAAPNHIKTKGPVRIFKEPDKNKIYVCGADAAEGVGGDSSVGVLVDALSREVVAVLSGNFKPYEFAHHLSDMCEHYGSSQRGMPLLAVERNNHGHAVLLELQQHIHYSNLYYRPLGSDDKDKNPGWVTDKITRPIMLNSFIDAVENKYLKLNDKYILGECLTLINNEGKIEAAAGKHDDSIIATSIALQLLMEAGNLAIYDDLSSKILL